MVNSQPVRSAVNKHHIAWSVLQWVTIWESPVLNSIVFFAFFPARYVGIQRIVAAAGVLTEHVVRE